MDQILLAKSAEKLKEILIKYSSTDAGALALFDALLGLIDDGRTGKIRAPIEWRDIPGAYHFTEGDLGKYSDLETAFAEFKIEATGGESPVLKRLRLNQFTKP